MWTDKYSLPFNPVTVSNSGEKVTLEPNAALLNDLAEELQVLSVEAFKTNLKVSRWQKAGLKVSGTVDLVLNQECVATLEPLSEVLAIDIERRFMPDGKFVRKHETMDEGELVLDPEAEDEPDEMLPTGIDLWDVILEEINIALDPFPRSEKSETPAETDKDETAGDEGDEETHRPFANLNTLINEKKSKN